MNGNQKENSVDLRWTTPKNSTPIERTVVLYLEEETEIGSKITVKSDTGLKVFFYNEKYIDHNIFSEGGYSKIFDMILNDDRCKEVNVVTPDMKEDINNLNYGSGTFRLITFRAWRGKRILGWFLKENR